MGLVVAGSLINADIGALLHLELELQSTGGRDIHF
jgi:hypothetical protein